MKNLLSKNLLSPILIAIAVWTAGLYPAEASTPGTNPASAASAEATAEQIEQATQAAEIRPGDWAYQTLQTLSAKYSCGNTPTGNQVLSREEFATSLNGCVQSIEQLVARRKPRRAIKKRRVAPAPTIEAAPEVVAPPPEPAPAPVAPPEPEPVEAAEAAVTQQDLDRLKGLIQSFSAELQSVDSRLQTAEEKVTKLQAQAFSTTTKLNGEAIISLSGYGGSGTVFSTNGVPNSRNTTILSNRVRLNFDTSFTGKDRLRTRLQSRNTPSFNSSVTGTNMTRLGYDGDEANTTNVSLLQYSLPLSSQTKIIVETIGSEFNENMPTFNPILASSGSGSISRFGRFNPIYRLSGDGASLTINHKFADGLDLAVGYAVPNINAAANPAAGSGLFNGSNSIISQLSFAPSKDFGLGLAYARSYSSDGNNITGGTGSSAANRPFGSTAAPVPVSANHYSLMTSYKLSPGFVLSGWAGFTEATREIGGGNASSSNYAISLAFPDLGQKGNNLAFILGIPPKLNSRNGAGFTAANGANIVNPDTSYHIEALYRVKLSDNLAITPGILFITNPEHNRANPTEYVGTVRTTFTF
ncbi:iron uptake porin [Chamaesiphon sp. OTE_8_metabat_110]|uniref:iron uptake porin n=1 Tax=Chamaesiphon sp. OTE_8_metabat_110 TaxID=2964696 RepID=UPI00286A6D89|nr:iron uptake porin [Chamaesiphon sp. OTE_8_metabat_110]